MTAEQARALVHTAADHFPPRGLAALLAAAAKVCPSCGGPLVTRSSRMVRGERLALLVCRSCGWRGTKSVSAHQVITEKGKVSSE
jgi:predicted RNA-binding Zn-ribbon protein involved in translation (DUF1610 family)